MSSVVLVASCGACESATPSATSTTSNSAADTQPASAPPPSAALSATGPWELAGEGDALALRRLALLHGAERLLELSRAGKHPAAALAAIAHAADAELVLGELVRLARDPGRGEQALRVILEIASRPPAQTEPLDPDSVGACIKQLDLLSRDKKVARQRRAVAISALRAFARAGLVDAGRISRELDPEPQ